MRRTIKLKEQQFYQRSHLIPTLLQDYLGCVLVNGNETPTCPVAIL